MFFLFGENEQFTRYLTQSAKGKKMLHKTLQKYE